MEGWVLRLVFSCELSLVSVLEEDEDDEEELYFLDYFGCIWFNLEYDSLVESLVVILVKVWNFFFCGKIVKMCDLFVKLYIFCLEEKNVL